MRKAFIYERESSEGMWKGACVKKQDKMSWVHSEYFNYNNIGRES